MIAIVLVNVCKGTTPENEGMNDHNVYSLIYFVDLHREQQ
jgi:hypothetical protein